MEAHALSVDELRGRADARRDRHQKKSDRAAVRRADGRHRRGEVGGTGRAESSRRGNDLHRSGRSRPLRGSCGARRCRRAGGVLRSLWTGAWTGARWRGSRSPPTRSAGWLEQLLWPRVGERVADVARRGVGAGESAGGAGRRDAAAVRSRARGQLRRDDRDRGRRGGARGAGRRTRPRRRWTNEPPDSSHRPKKPPARDLRCRELRQFARIGAGAVGGSCEAEDMRSAQSASTTRSRPASRGRRVSRARAWRRRLLLVVGLSWSSRRRALARASRPITRCARSSSRCATRTSSASRRADKGVDASLIAAVIYTESRFRYQTSQAGATGLMQIMPETADYIARKSGGTQFTRDGPRDPADQHRLRHLVPALPAGQVRGQHDPHPGRLQRRRGQGRRVARGGRRRTARSSGSRRTCPSRRRATTCTACSPHARTTGAPTARNSHWNNSPTRASWGVWTPPPPHSPPAAPSPVIASNPSPVVAGWASCTERRSSRSPGPSR